MSRISLIEDYIHKTTLLSEQIDKRELGVILRELQCTLEADVAGDVVEFGCFQGTTSVHLAKFLQKADKVLWLYDSFKGLPDKTAEDDSPAGMHFKAGELRASKKELVANIRRARVPMPHIKKAWFSDLTSQDIPPCISFAFLDGDYYASIRDPLRLIEQRLSPGAVILVDDYVNEALPGAAQAADEWARQHSLTVMAEASLGIIRLPV